jgi:Rrf2 family protein
MKISTKGRYGLEAVLDLALHSSGSHESLRNIAKRRNISENYLEQLFVVLRRKGIVESIRGAQGGYRLARDPMDIKAGEVIRALEGSLSPVDCADEGCGPECGRADKCVTRSLWKRLREDLDEAADGLSIHDLMEACYKIDPAVKDEYYI